MRVAVAAWVLGAWIACGCTAPPDDAPDAGPEVRCPGTARLCPNLTGYVVSCEGDVCMARAIHGDERRADCDDTGLYPTRVDNDAENCGACWHRCGGEDTCVRGNCESPPCPPGLMRCEGVCVDVATAQGNCGVCGNVCYSGQCAGSRCVCPNGLQTCLRAPRCTVDVETDASNCGRCGAACPADQRCTHGVCDCRPELTRCDGACVDLATDRNHCGSCGAACPADQWCTHGVCDCRPELTRCDGACVDLATDRNHCGSCGTRCGVGSWCERSVCRTCAAGQMRCGEVCFEVDHDPRHCGACDTVCGRGTTCAGGRCVAVPFALQAPISSTYVTSARPWLRWVLPPGVEGAHVELCATRSCGRVVGSWDATGSSLRVPAALAPGAYFWRAFARRGGAVDATPTPVWDFVVPTTPGAANGGFLDVNGDGLEDRFEQGRLDVGVFFGRSGAPAVMPDQAIPWPELPPPASGVFRGNDYGVPHPVGDLDGDGYGDFILAAVTRIDSPYPLYHPTLFAYRGGPRGLATPWFWQIALYSEIYLVNGIYALSSTGDHDGDGFGDAGFVFGGFAYPLLSFFGASSLVIPGGFSSVPSGECLAPLVAGDFNADSYGDIVLACGSVMPTDRPALVSLGGPWARFTTERVSASPLPSCGMPAPIAPTMTRQYAVLDRDLDGYDDLRIDTPGRASLLYRGGPDGLTSARCEMLPATP